MPDPNRRMLLPAIADVQAGQPEPALADASKVAALQEHDTVEGFAPAHDWEPLWRNTAAAKRAQAPRAPRSTRSVA